MLKMSRAKLNNKPDTRIFRAATLETNIHHDFDLQFTKRDRNKIHPRPREILREIATTIIRKKYSLATHRPEGFRKTMARDRRMGSMLATANVTTPPARFTIRSIGRG